MIQLNTLLATLLCALAKILTGVRAVWRNSAPEARTRVYFANHCSHGDFLLIWACLPRQLRQRTRPVASADYWRVGRLRPYLASAVFNSVLIERSLAIGGANPITQMGEALQAGDSLILFPEGTRNLGDDVQAFKSGLYYLARSYQEVELVPVWIENLGRAMPKGSWIPVPLLCSLTFGQAITLGNESRDSFLERCRNALLDLAPRNPP